ncbi:hypothetical protein ACFQRB_04585 [Halobaculum litoreum]|uniref:Oligoendopeptidase F n=1 Tax=Halobaculum litoreum TaxID=3031998 RepID=A0ABD5XM12_9EURY
MSLPDREAVPDAEKWDPSLVFETPADWEAAADAFADRLDELRAYEDRATADGETLRELLDLVEERGSAGWGRCGCTRFSPPPSTRPTRRPATAWPATATSRRSWMRPWAS